MPAATPPCPVCAAATEPAGTKHSAFSGRDFTLAHCPSCRYSFVVDPRTDFDQLYDDAYYAGRGADPHVSYTDAVSRQGSVLEYEWRGVVEILTDLGGLSDGVRWLDFGCGMGGLLRHGREQGYDVVGFDEGHAAELLHAEGLPTLTASELDGRAGSFDVVTAIEVVEHLVDPMPTFARMASLLAPGGLLFITTGNAAPYRGRLPSWQYVRPDIHVSFYEPATLARCMADVGLQPADGVYRRGHTDLIRSKVLRTVGVNRRNVVERCLPWPVLSRLADRRFGVSRQPVAWRRPAGPVSATG